MKPLLGQTRRRSQCQSSILTSRRSRRPAPDDATPLHCRRQQHRVAGSAAGHMQQRRFCRSVSPIPKQDCRRNVTPMPRINTTDDFRRQSSRLRCRSCQETQSALLTTSRHIWWYHLDRCSRLPHFILHTNTPQNCPSLVLLKFVFTLRVTCHR